MLQHSLYFSSIPMYIGALHSKFAPGSHKTDFRKILAPSLQKIYQVLVQFYSNKVFILYFYHPKNTSNISDMDKKLIHEYLILLMLLVFETYCNKIINIISITRCDLIFYIVTCSSKF